MLNIPTSAKPHLTDDAQLWIDDEPDEMRQFVIYANSQRVGPHGIVIQSIPLDLVEDDADGGAVARAMIAASEIYTADDGWTIERVDAEHVPTGDMALLVERLAKLDDWDEFIGLPAGVCASCGGSGVQEACGDVDSQCITMQGDCERCLGSGRG